MQYKVSDPARVLLMAEERSWKITIRQVQMNLPPVVVSHAQNLDHTDEDVDKVQLEANGLVDDILADKAPLGHASVVKDLLDVVESEASEDGKTTIQPDLLRPHQSTGGGGGKDKRRESREGNDGHTGKQRCSKVQVLLLLSRGTNESNRAHHSNSVETSTSEKSGVHEHQRRKERSLGEVKASPETVLHNVASRKLAAETRTSLSVGISNLLVGRSVESTIHRSDAGNQTDTSNKPRVRGHETIRPTARVESSSSNTDDSNTKSSVHKSFVQIRPFVVRHSAIFPCLPVEDQVCRQDSSTNDSRAIN